MSIRQSFIITFCFIALYCSQVFAQEDVMYLKNETKKIGKITEINKDKVVFLPSPDAKPEKLAKADLVLVLFENGAWLTFPTEFKGVEGPPESRHAEDWLLTKDQGIVSCVIQNAEGNPVLVSAMSDSARKDYSVPKDELSGILFANGNKQLLGTKPATIAEILKKKNMISTSAFLSKYEVKPVDTVKKKKGLGPELDLDKASYEQFKQKSLQKTDDLGKYLNLIANKSTESSVASKAVEQAVGLFFSDSSLVETTKPNGEKDQQPIRHYLNKLKLLKYSKVLIEWTDISYVSNLRKAPDGFYYGVISLQQKFSGFIDNKLVYSDVTRKNVEVVLKTYKKEVEGESVELWDVFLNNVGISASRN
ncbi:MAG TPA: hypothetical protein PLK63_11075 [Catalimonadaceae bacterium]|nr:hypothetical protein [Catalimonadaceae bacterium]